MGITLFDVSYMGRDGKEVVFCKNYIQADAWKMAEYLYVQEHERGIKITSHDSDREPWPVYEPTGLGKVYVPAIKFYRKPEDEWYWMVPGFIDTLAYIAKAKEFTRYKECLMSLMELEHRLRPIKWHKPDGEKLSGDTPHDWYYKIAVGNRMTFVEWGELKDLSKV